MNTYQIFKQVSHEYFIEANSQDEAIYKALNADFKPESIEVLSCEVSDIHNGTEWENEK